MLSQKNLSLSLFLWLLCMNACSDPHDPQSIVDQAIAAHGGDRYQHSIITFDFRGRHYTARRNGGQFTYERSFRDSTGQQVRDVLNNDGLFREVNGQRVVLTDERRNAFSKSVNAVIYFALLPYRLNDPAVQKRFLGETTIKGKRYDKVEVTFKKEGGGIDHTDIFIYWIEQNNHTVDYLAYTNEGLRFREAFNPRVVNGIRFEDYANYESKLFPQAPVTQLDSLFSAGKLQKLSGIVTENVEVKLTD